MNIKSKFELGQRIYLVKVDDRMKRENCSVCGGSGKTIVTDQLGGEHTVSCPASTFNSDRPDDVAACRYGSVDICMGSVVEVRPVTVGQIKIKIGGLSGNCNMADHDEQTYERHESVMCYETGIGSGNVFDVEVRSGGSQIFATEGEARTWGDAEVAVRDAMREKETAEVA